ncbi:transcription factor GAGA-like isoform X1 [Macrosteles quadrilineatus]|uniref:transcription factor GAGA-like isoform X1 n=1 Tax=Macrosteles quadrilineatus TaxID=74068 RepID=UPI0023E24661|nr:transcription factor GAGA-like isoform X1 [Macrosteles quadrilineatus]XP_054283001.1 transcription factor GAGA-like isoform X1 [Macrosteles quadrilineatus]XP_054283002.1 transcription factor GAGA-like isoform X1 [Macrosteles quadrilineatus]XP_054283003.1 transcription factor GAGA-like isoform X1 [Macrosteles quadrilineatus]XP_054283004.1 transcription factor GAGA-like isoform X1 [Macrosteles quadrilineatus]XP_054283005.1 transcription factor GAGA-like isoform X1 [Macrosteles quadrilineatus]
MGSQQLYSLSWGEFGTSLTSTVQILRGHGEMVDVTLAAGGRIFPAHKLVLSAASPLLMELLKSTHCHHPVVMLAGITAPDLEALLQFVYQGEVSVDPSQLPSLLQAAHCLDIQALSPQTLTTEKTMAQISVPVVMGDTSMAPMSRETSMTSPLLPHRKRKRRQNRASETERESHWTNVSVGNVAVESQTMEGSAIQDSGDDSMKDEIIDEQHCNGEPGSTKKLVSDLPVECTVCGVTLRQSRNLRRHMELIHLKVENGGKQRKVQIKDETKKPEDEGTVSVQTVQTLTEVVSPMEQTTVNSSAGPSRMATAQTNVLGSPPMYHSHNSHTHTHTHSSTQCDQLQYSQLQFSQPQQPQQQPQQSPDVYRHQQLLRSAGLYADTREQHCATE